MTPLITVDLLHRAGVPHPDPWIVPLNSACIGADIVTPPRVATFLGNILNETGNLTTLAESLDYSASALVKQWPTHFDMAFATKVGRTATHPANQIAIAERAYGGRGGNRPEGQGDGWLFRGHGCIQITFRANYADFARRIKWAGSVDTLPAYITTVEGASRSAAIYWQQAGCNGLADAGAWEDLRRRINGGEIGMLVAMERCRQVAGLLGYSVPTGAHVGVPPVSEADALNAAELARG